MRLGLEPPSPRMAPHSRHPSPSPSRASAFSPIDVDGDSSDNAEPPPASNDPSRLPAASNGPSPPLYSTSKTRYPTRSELELAYESSDESEKKQSEHKDDEPKAKSRLNFFFNVQDPSKTLPRASDRERRSLSRSPSPPDELPEVIYASRTNICGERYDRCELEFGSNRVELTIWQAGARKWRGQVKYAHMVRFCFSRGKRPPYILLLQMDQTKGRSQLAEFYDSVFARHCSQASDKMVASPKVYGVVFYFDQEIDYMRCRSMGDNIPKLAHLFGEELSENEVRNFSKWDAAQKPRLLKRSAPKSSASSGSGGGSLASAVGNGARQAFSTVASFFTPRSSGTSVLEGDEHHAVVRDRGKTSSGRTLNLSRESTGTSPDSGEEKMPIPIDGSGTGKRESVVIIENTQDELGRSKSLVDASASFSLQEEKTNERMETRKRAAASQREDERLKRRRIETRRNEVLLTYPYDGSDTAGRISVTLGDVDRLVPGEFLNDNIIDFYLRFLWRHLESWQQQQMYFFTSHFFTQLNGTNGAHELATDDPDERFARVARWTQKETNLFDKRFLFIPINDSFHWSIAVFCNPGSAIVKKHRRVRRRRQVKPDVQSVGKREVVDLVSGDGRVDGGEEHSEDTDSGGGTVEEEVQEEELQSCREDRLANPPCLLFLDSLRCHRKKKFTKMLRGYLECEWKARFASSADDQKPRTTVDADGVEEEESLVTVFDSESISLLEPNIPLQSNSSDCGVFLLMYAASIVRRFPIGVNRDAAESNLSSTLTPDMFRDEHVLEFREYLQQLLFSLQFLEKHGLPEQRVKEEGLESFVID